ncbi:hypothetical protein CEXT_147391 [Caerostris extrusa]|uniref:Uncharacterized protein n=1 Tax=Caerostris extrusa TaxID=172846 RepID=A0AAV4M681_CAEEX|nr:hypothetical protein CEXT_147391 [Caerostris extrusa]
MLFSQTGYKLMTKWCDTILKSKLNIKKQKSTSGGKNPLFLLSNPFHPQTHTNPYLPNPLKATRDHRENQLYESERICEIGSPIYFSKTNPAVYFFPRQIN